MHAIGDFFLQGRKLSNLKALKMNALLEHAGIYTLVFIVLSPLALGLTFLQGLAFSMLNGSLHFVIDFFTGKFKQKYLNTNESKYIATIGIDTTLHILILVASYIYLFPETINHFAPLLKY
jgi:hypothetical protein